MFYRVPRDHLHLHRLRPRLDGLEQLRPVRIAAMFVVICVASVIAMPVAHAAESNSCTEFSPCSGLTWLQVSSPSGFTGAGSHLRVSYQNIGYPQNPEYTTNSLVIAYGSGSNSPPYIEVGVFNGNDRGHQVSTPHFFWSELNQYGNWYFFIHDAYTLSSDATVAVVKSSSNDSSVWYPGGVSQSTNSLSYPAKQLTAGTRSNSDYTASYASAFNFTWADLWGGWHDDWTTSSSAAGIYTYPNGGPVWAYGVGNQPYVWMRSGQ